MDAEACRPPRAPQTEHTTLFNSFDHDHNGKLTKQEYHEMQRMENDGETHATVALNEAGQAADILARADKNGDGVRHAAPAAALSCCPGANNASQGERPLA